jgi:plastocyanin
MHQAADHVKQEDLKKPTRRSLPVLGKVTAVALLGQAIAVTVQMLITLLPHGTFMPGFFIAIIPALAALLAAGFIVSRVRWAPALVSGVAFLTATLWLFAPDYQYDLTHPGGNVIDFILLVIILAFALVAVVAGVGATIQNYQSAEPRTPQGLRPFLTALSGIVVGMIAVALIVAANPQAGSASTDAGGEPTVYIGGTHFIQDIVLVPKGSRLRIVNDSSVEHILQNGRWSANGAAQTVAESGAPAVHNVDIKGGDVEIGPFTTTGVFHIYCTLHSGMNLTIVVE